MHKLMDEMDTHKLIIRSAMHACMHGWIDRWIGMDGLIDR